MKPKVGVLELIASTAALHDRLRPAFWMELAVKRQFYSVMPQAVSVWARRFGCRTTYATYFGVGRPERLMPDDLDILFLSTPTQHAALAYALATIFRRRGVRVVLAGPHARAFPEDCARFGDVVVTTCDRALVEDILRGDVGRGDVVASARPLADLPLVEERDPEIRAASFVNGRQRRSSTIALVASLGCPYDCDFCSEWATPYAAFDADRLGHELDAIARLFPGALIAFHDPNFGLRFEETMAAFEARADRRRFVMECSLSLLTPPRLARLRDAGCLMAAPGIESWLDYSAKSGASRVSGAAKFATVSARLRAVEAALPAVQANLILGVDADAGDEPFELTRRLIETHPLVWTNLNMPIPFGGTPFAAKVRREGRLVEALPFAFWGAPYPAMRPLNYELGDYLGRLDALYGALTAPRLLIRRLAALGAPLARLVVAGRTAALRAEHAELRAFRQVLERDASVRHFFEGTSRRLPDFLAARLRARLGRYHDALEPEDFTPRHGPAAAPTLARAV